MHTLLDIGCLLNYLVICSIYTKLPVISLSTLVDELAFKVLTHGIGARKSYNIISTFTEIQSTG